MPQHQYLESYMYMYIITVFTSLYYILKHKTSNLTTYTRLVASTDQSVFSLFIRQNFITINLQPASYPPFKCTVVPSKSDSDFMFSLQSYQGLRIDISREY